MIKLLIVDDSPVAQQFLTYIFSHEKEIEVVGIVNDGVEALEFVSKQKPDIITMDINMPKLNGFETTKAIMESNPIPIVILTASFNESDVTKSFNAIKAGAVSIIKKPVSLNHPDFIKEAKHITETIKLMSEIKVVKHREKVVRSYNETLGFIKRSSETGNTGSSKVVAIGVSTGGPPVLQTILSNLHNTSMPILIVQHITPGFIEGLVNWLSQSSKLPINIAQNGQKALPGEVYFAPDGYHMGIDAAGNIVLSESSKENGMRPSVSHLYRSAARSFGENTIGIILTGMGVDGAKELKQLRDMGAITIAQDKDTCAVYGMPGEAVKLNAAGYVLAPEKIADFISCMKP